MWLGTEYCRQCVETPYIHPITTRPSLVVDAHVCATCGPWVPTTYYTRTLQLSSMRRTYVHSTQHQCAAVVYRVTTESLRMPDRTELSSLSSSRAHSHAVHYFEIQQQSLIGPFFLVWVCTSDIRSFFHVRSRRLLSMLSITVDCHDGLVVHLAIE